MPQIDPFKITEEGIGKRLSGLNPNKPASPDKLQQRLLKELIDGDPHLQCLEKKKVLRDWKTTTVALVFKKG